MDDSDGRVDGGDTEVEASNDNAFAPFDKPRIRHITGIRIHQLTLPESLPYASKLVGEHHAEGYMLDDHGEGSSHLVTSPASDITPGFSQHQRRSSTSSFPFPSRRFGPLSQENDLTRQRSTSTSSDATIEPPSSPSVSTFLSHSLPRTTRVTRPRAPTLAGEALEHGHAQGSGQGQGSVTFTQHLHGSLDEQMELIEEGKKRLARCFVVLKAVPAMTDAQPEKRSNGDVPKPRRTNSDETASQQRARDAKMTGLKRPITSRTSSSASTSSSSVPSTPIANGRPSLSASPSNSSLITRTSSASTNTTRTRTTSMTSPGKSGIPSTLSSTNGFAKRPGSAASFRTTTTTRLSDAGPSSPRGNTTFPLKSRPGMSGKRNYAGGSHGNLPSPKERPIPVNVPFFISPIHPPSTHPRFTSLEHGDFAPWLSVNEFASTSLELEVWIETDTKWKRMEGIGGVVRLDKLRKGYQTRPNGLEFTLSTHPKSIFYLPGEDEQRDEGRMLVEGGVMERSMRETRMKKGVGVGGLHQLVNMHAVIADTERGVCDVKRKANKLLFQDVDRRALRREVSEREEKVKWINEKILEVEKVTKEIQARTTLREQALEKRRDNLADADTADELLHGRARDLEDEIGSIEYERTSLFPQIHALRATHIQTLDTLFPIQPLDPSQLLYTIINVPLPIPSGPKDPAPPLSLPAHKVDERTTAAALGYVAMVVQILGNLGGAQSGGLPYAVTCAGSRSAVRDGVSVMQGPRSFPLYAKGVERYRYEYAVFLLNKNIEMLMQEANIRLLDLRHTLPNLKNLLLTLSSPVLPSSSHNVHSSMWRSTATTPTFMNSRASSAAWPKGSMGTMSPASSVGSPASLSTTRVGGMGTGTPSPIVKRGRGGRRSMLSRTASMGRRGNEEVELASDDESDLDNREESSVGGDGSSIVTR
ncbi:hypothetical protein CI109_100161 [Kwoniella shandongensis]|uniref:Uncharacterized protein n=1 Tax=Kwoniella shandongensis TaxID=1734106 RepID=A0A5M6BXZ1_9TREE|nr:uncharacterized protein CI109_005761 [Kwoniella shandongensis]KAA5525879.1 hypothetical protein CI109_005761 [Kwoniella shandongensis]